MNTLAKNVIEKPDGNSKEVNLTEHPNEDIQEDNENSKLSSEFAMKLVNAVKSLNNQEINYTHPHNDVIAGFISGGVLGGFAALISLISGLSASILAPNRNTTKLYLALMLSCSTMVTGNVSTILFNDICSAWLAFSTYLIWATDFKDEPQNQKVQK